MRRSKHNHKVMRVLTSLAMVSASVGTAAAPVQIIAVRADARTLSAPSIPRIMDTPGETYVPDPNEETLPIPPLPSFETGTTASASTGQTTQTLPTSESTSEALQTLPASVMTSVSTTVTISSDQILPNPTLPAYLFTTTDPSGTTTAVTDPTTESTTTETTTESTTAETTTETTTESTTAVTTAETTTESTTAVTTTETTTESTTAVTTTETTTESTTDVTTTETTTESTTAETTAETTTESTASETTADTGTEGSTAASDSQASASTGDTSTTETTTESATDSTASETTTETTASGSETGEDPVPADKPDDPQTVTVQILTDENGRRYAVNGKGEMLSGLIVLSSGILVGDVTGDGIVNVEDATLILIASAARGSSGSNAEQYLLDHNTTLFGDTDTAKRYGDADGSGAINASDATTILIYAAAAGADPNTPPLGGDSGTYYAGADGYLLTGVIQDEASGNTYLADETGKLLTGWQTITSGDSTVSYFLNADGTMAKSQWSETPDGRTVYLQEDGTVKTGGMLVLEDATYCIGTDGTKLTGFQTVDGKSYSFDADGKLQKGLLVIGDATYYADENGVLRTGCVTVGEDVYCFKDDLTMLTADWFTDEKGMRYFDADGKMCRGWTNLIFATYYFNEEGYKQTGLLELDGKFYLLDENGARLTGWRDVDGKHVFFSHEDGSMVTGWQTIDGIRYYFNEDGSMAADTEIEGQKIQPNGYAMSDLLYEATLTVQAGMTSHEPTPDGIFDYVRETNRYKKIENTKSLEQLNEIGWSYLVNFASKNYYTVCYYMAAKMDYILRLYGYECRVVHATHDSGDHYWNQVLIGEEWVNFDPTNNLRNYTWEQMVAYGNYEFLGNLNPEYK